MPGKVTPRDARADLPPEFAEPRSARGIGHGFAYARGKARAALCVARPCRAYERPAAGEERYHEFNFSPSGEWAAYAFTGYREGTSLIDEALNPQIAVESGEGRLDLYALVELPRLSPAFARSRLRLGLAVIIEEDNGGMSYWALKHAAGRPDFHHGDAFTLELDEFRH